MKKVYFFIGMISLLFPCKSFAYRPFITEDAGVAGSGVAQLEVSYDFINWNSEENEGQILIVPIYGIGERFEFSLEIPYLFHNFSDTGYTRGGGDLNCAGKLLTIHQGEFYPAFTLKGVVKTDSGNPEKGIGTGHFDYSLQMVFTHEFNKFILHGTFGYSVIGHDEEERVRNIYIYGAGTDWNFFEKFHLIAEVAGNRHPDRTVRGEQVQAVLGAIYELTEMLSFDFALRAGVTDISPEWSITSGLTLTYGGE